MSGQPISTPGGPTLAPTRPIAYLGGAGNDSSVDAYRNGTNFPNGGKAYFLISPPGPPGIMRNSWRGPRYFATDFSLVKSTKVPNRILGEATLIDLRCNMFNAFNNLKNWSRALAVSCCASNSVSKLAESHRAKCAGRQGVAIRQTRCGLTILYIETSYCSSILHFAGCSTANWFSDCCEQHCTCICQFASVVNTDYIGHHRKYQC